MLFAPDQEGIDYSEHANRVVIPHVQHDLFQSIKCLKLWYIKAIAQELFEELLRDVNIILLAGHLAVFFND